MIIDPRPVGIVTGTTCGISGVSGNAGLLTHPGKKLSVILHVAVMGTSPAGTYGITTESVAALIFEGNKVI